MKLIVFSETRCREFFERFDEITNIAKMANLLLFVQISFYDIVGISLNLEAVEDEKNRRKI